MGKTKEKEEKAKVKKRKDSASRNSSSSRRGLEQTVARADPPGSTADGHDDDAASVLSLSSSGGVSGYAGTPRFPAVEAHTEHRVLVRREGGPIVPPPPDPMPVIWLVSMGFRLRPRTLRLRF